MGIHIGGLMNSREYDETLCERSRYITMGVLKQVKLAMASKRKVVGVIVKGEITHITRENRKVKTLSMPWKM